MMNETSPLLASSRDTSNNNERNAPITKSPFDQQQPNTNLTNVGYILRRLFPTAESNYTLKDFFTETTTGLVNAIICIPVLYGFTLIVYSHDIFDEYRPFLVKLMLWSSVMHQLSMSLFSSLSFSIAQCQDAGMVFLGTMTTKLVEAILTDQNIDPHNFDATQLSTVVLSTIVSSSVFIVAFYTTALGFALIGVSRRKLAKLVTYLPLSVLSAYLAFIGLFCVQAGVSISTGYSISHPNEIIGLIKNHTKDSLLAIPGLLLGVGLMICVRKIRNTLTLPLCLIAIPVIFYILALCFGYNIDELRTLGFLSTPHETNVVTNASDVLNFFAVDFTKIPIVFFDWILMVLFVAFSSALDIIAIEIELGTPLDIDAELHSVGLSNIISGSLLGYTGSYIFSQTIFTSRTKPKSRWPGLIVAILEVVALLSPFDLVSLLPRMFFSATLSFIGFELITEWLIQQYLHNRVQIHEYVLTLITFFAILFTNLQFGLCIGMLCALTAFIIMYTQQYSIDLYNFYHPNTVNISGYLPQFVVPMLYSSSRQQNQQAIQQTNQVYNNITNITSEDDKDRQEFQHLQQQIQQQLSKDVYILQLSGHLQFMTTPKLLDKVKEIVHFNNVLQQEEYAQHCQSNNNNNNNGFYSSSRSVFSMMNECDVQHFGNNNNNNNNNLMNSNGQQQQQDGTLTPPSGLEGFDSDPFNVMVSPTSTKITDQKQNKINTNPAATNNFEKKNQQKQRQHDKNNSTTTQQELDINLIAINSPIIHDDETFNNNNNNKQYNTFGSPSSSSSKSLKKTTKDFSIPINKTIVLDCTNVFTMDSSALRTFKLIINLCHQYNHLTPSSSTPNDDSKNTNNNDNNNTNHDGNDENTCLISPPLNSSPPLNNSPKSTASSIISSATLSLASSFAQKQQQSLPPIVYDVLFVGLSDINLKLLYNNNIPIYNTNNNTNHVLFKNANNCASIINNNNTQINNNNNNTSSSSSSLLQNNNNTNNNQHTTSIPLLNKGNMPKFLSIQQFKSLYTNNKIIQLLPANVLQVLCYTHDTVTSLFNFEENSNDLCLLTQQKDSLMLGGRQTTCSSPSHHHNDDNNDEDNSNIVHVERKFNNTLLKSSTQQQQQQQPLDNINNITYPTFLPPHIIQQYILKHIDNTNTEYYTTRDNLIAAHFDDIVQCKIYIVAKYYYLNLLNNVMNK